MAAPDRNTPSGQAPAPEDKTSGWLVEGADPSSPEGAPESSHANEWLPIGPDQGASEPPDEPAPEDADGSDWDPPGAEQRTPEKPARSKADPPAAAAAPKRREAPEAPPEAADERPSRPAPAERASRAGSGRLAERVAKLERRLTQLESATSEWGPDSQAGAATEVSDRLERLEAELRSLAEARTEERDQIEAILEELQGVHVAETARREQERAMGKLRSELAELRRAAALDRELVNVLSERFSGRGEPEPGSGEALDLNTASFEQLRGLGISVTQASRLIAARESTGGYGSLDELDGLPGFSPEQLAALKRTVRV